MANQFARMVTASIKEHFFDREVVQKQMDKTARAGLSRMGGYMRRVARSSIKKKGLARKPPKGSKAYDRWLDEQRNRPRSKPGDPVFQHSDHSLLNPRNILYGWDGRDSIIIGMMGYSSRFAKAGAVPHQVEFGSSNLVENPRRRDRVLGGVGEVRVGGNVSRATKRAAKTRLGDVMVTYAKLRTTKQVAAANAINERLYGPDEVPVKTAARPVMGPALAKTIAKFDEAFVGGLKG